MFGEYLEAHPIMIHQSFSMTPLPTSTHSSNPPQPIITSNLCKRMCLKAGHAHWTGKKRAHKSGKRKEQKDQLGSLSAMVVFHAPSFRLVVLVPCRKQVVLMKMSKMTILHVTQKQGALHLTPWKLTKMT